LQLGPAFQGGALTNLTLAGIALSNNLPIKGPVTIENVGFGTDLDTAKYAGYFGEGIQGTYTIENGGLLTLFNCLVSNNVVVTNGGVLEASQDSFYNPLTVAMGGVFYPITNNFFAPLTITSEGIMNVAALNYFYQPLTNAGTINLTNSVLLITSNSVSGFAGAMINQAGGVIDMFDSTLPGAIGSAVDGNGPFINAGQINFLTGSGFVGLIGGTCVNSGVITDKSGVLVLDGNWTFTSSSSLQVGLNSATSYGSIIYSTNFPAVVGNLMPQGSLIVTLANGYVPTNGSVFKVLAYGSETGTFSGLNLPSAVQWNTQYGATNLSLIVGAGAPRFGTFDLVKTNFILGGIGGTAGSNYLILTSTNLTIPLANWTALTTNAFDAGGNFRFTNPASPAKPSQFFILKPQ
jgi:hypothetical protein